MFLIGFPLLVIPFALYNMIAFLTPGVLWSHEVTKVTMVSGVEWTLTAGDVLLALALFVLFVEVLKSTRVSRSIMDHLLSMVLFIGMLIEFLLVKQAATGTFFLLLVIGFLDVIAGFSITIRTAQRDVEIDAVDKVA